MEADEQERALVKAGGRDRHKNEHSLSERRALKH